MSQYFPTFDRLWHGNLHSSPWRSTPWWPADTLATKQKALLRILGVAAEERLEAAPLVAALSIEHRGRYRRRLRHLGKRLALGTALADALEQTPGVLSDEDALAIRFGDQSGTLPAVLSQLVNRPAGAESRIMARLRQIGFYTTLTLAIFAFILTFMMIKIIPSFQAIFDDFEMDLPRALVVLIVICSWVEKYWFLIAIPLLAVLWLWKSERSRRFFRRTVSSRLIRPIAQLRSADLLSLLSVNARAGRPLAGAMSTLARYHFDAKIRQKLLFVRNEMEQGVDAWNSMATARLLTPQEARALASSTTTDSRAWTMDRLADLRRGRVERRLDLYLSLLQPAVTLLMAAAVLFVAVACLSPLFGMVEALSG
ncbi:MAG: type II secretion system F family protein [Bythopirellula sp.]|nr:type II secretion system F family protein [Bythopirellula sp.]